jgi:hypothetical protein
MDGLHSIYMNAFLNPKRVFVKLISHQDHLKAGFVFMLYFYSVQIKIYYFCMIFRRTCFHWNTE